MRVIEPRHHFKPKKVKPPLRSRLTKAAGLLLLLAVVGYVLFGQRLVTHDNGEADSAGIQETPSTSSQRRLKDFSGEEFKALYSSFAYPNTQPLTESPNITGNPKADKRIIDIAKQRGYQLSAIPVSNIAKVDEPYLTDDDLLQPNALLAWRDLKQAAVKAGIKLQITSAYRSIEFQRGLFLRGLADAGISVFGIADGYSDAAVAKVLERTALPGYSRHHTGYTIDLACDGIGLDGFKTTSCYAWLSKNNFENAKKFGWVPSYPEEAANQGPEPEAWEYIWVGTQSLYE